jgi:ribulose-phosphate 3-epimerase
VLLEEILDELDLVLVMTVNPGFGGQHFIEYTLKKIRQVRKMLDSRNPKCELEVDGGIEARNAPRVVKAGAGVLVAGTAVFGHEGGAKAGMEALTKSLSRK